MRELGRHWPLGVHKGRHDMTMLEELEEALGSEYSAELSEMRPRTLENLFNDLNEHGREYAIEEHIVPFLRYSVRYWRRMHSDLSNR